MNRRMLWITALLWGCATAAHAQEGLAPIEGSSQSAEIEQALSVLPSDALGSPASAREEPAATEREDPAPARSLGDRYVDALAGSWAGTGIALLAGGVGAATLGVIVGCSVAGGLGCFSGFMYGSVAGGGAGLFLGPGIGTAAGAGLDAGEGFLMWGLGVLTEGAVLAIAVGVGRAVDAANDFASASGLLDGIIWGSIIGFIAQCFLTPLYAVAIYEDRPPPCEARLAPYAAPTNGGITAGLLGAF